MTSPLHQFHNIKRTADPDGPETLTLLHKFFATYETQPDDGRAEWLGIKTSLDPGLSLIEKKRLRDAELREGSLRRMIFKIGARGLPLVFMQEHGTYMTHRTSHHIRAVILRSHICRSWKKPHIPGNAEKVDIRVITR